jgi:NitT/TauT family transport system substrate-binding protein
MRAPPPRESLTIAVARSTFGAPVWVAQGQGFFAAEGLHAVLRPYPFGKLALEAMLGGEADVATVAEAPLMFAALAGAPVRVIANYASSNEHSLVARADRGIARVADLPGRRVGFTFGTTSHYVLHVLLSDAGLSETDLTVVDLPAPQLAAALAVGRVDAVVAFPPYSSECRRALGANARILSAGSRYTGYSSLAVRPEFPRDRAEVALRLLRAMDRTIAWMREHPRESAVIAAQGSGVDPGLLQESLDTLRPNLGLDQGFVVLLRSEARWALAAGLTANAVPSDMRNVVDPSVLQRLHPESVTLLGAP